MARGNSEGTLVHDLRSACYVSSGADKISSILAGRPIATALQSLPRCWQMHSCTFLMVNRVLMAVAAETTLWMLQSRRLFGTALASLLSFIIASVACAEMASSKRPHIVMLVADDLGSRDVGWRGSDIKTPHLDELAAAGARLTQFYVQPVCTPTRAALLTGRYPFRYGLQTEVIRPWAQYGLPLSEELLTADLKLAGYATAIVGKWHLGHCEPALLPTHRGFDHQYGPYNGAIDYYTHERDGGFDWHRDDEVSRDEGYATELLGSEAERLIRNRDRDRPLFLYVPFNGVHLPAQVPKEYEAPFADLQPPRRQYAAMVAALDAAVGKIAGAIREEGLMDDTLFIFFSDNGGPEYGGIADNGALRGGKGTLYEGGVLSCAFATWTGHIPEGDIDAPMHVVDWRPTIRRLIGIDKPPQLPLDGLDVWSSICTNAKVRGTLVLNVSNQSSAIRIDRWKLLVNGQMGLRDDDLGKENTQQAPLGDGSVKVELFDLDNDPGERRNLAIEDADKAAELWRRLAAYAREAVPPKSAPKPADFISPKVWGERD